MQGGQPMTQEQQAEQAAEREEADMQRQGMLAAIMQPSARERCALLCQFTQNVDICCCVLLWGQRRADADSCTVQGACLAAHATCCTARSRHY